MDQVTAAVLGPWQQFGLVGSVVIALSAAIVMLWRALDSRTVAHLRAVEKCHEQTLDISVKQTEANNRMASALDGLEKVVETALAAMRK